MYTALFPDACPRNQPALGQTYATVVFGEGRVPGEQMLSVEHGLWTTATAAVHKALFQLTHCQESVRLQAVAAANNMRVVSTSQLCDIRSQERMGLAAEPLVNLKGSNYTNIIYSRIECCSCLFEVLSLFRLSIFCRRPSFIFSLSFLLSPGRLDHPAWCVVWRVD